jgi:SAM-dependent methyltransferase
MTLGFDSDPVGGARVLSRLKSVGFSEESVGSRLGLEDLNDLKLRAVPIYRAERLRERDPLASAIDLFLLQGALPRAELDALFDASTQRDLRSSGILDGDGASARALVSIYPVGQDLIVSDHASHELDPSDHAVKHHDRVMYIGTDSRWLARVTVRRPFASALDLCCGSGIHALLAASHATRVTAVDVNPRAIRCTLFNAKLRGLTNVEALLGDLYAPVGEQRFELITANPPFVPAPSQSVGFRDGGPDGEDVQRRIIEGLPQHLAPGGVAQIVTELGENDSEPLEQRLRRWLPVAPIDIHVLRLRTHSAEAYAIGHADGDTPADFLRSVGLWAENLNAQGYRRIVSVLLTFQWSEGSTWSRVDRALPPKRTAGGEIEAIFAAERLSRDAGLAQRLRVGRVVRTNPVAIFESRTLGAELAPSIQARLLGQALSVEHPLSPLELELLAGTQAPLATATVLAAAARANVSEEAVLSSLVSLIGKGFVGIA